MESVESSIKGMLAIKKEEHMKEIPTWEKLNITVEEAAAYFGIGMNKIRELMNEIDCNFVLKVGCKKSLIKRAKFEQYILTHEAI